LGERGSSWGFEVFSLFLMGMAPDPKPQQANTEGRGKENVE